MGALIPPSPLACLYLTEVMSHGTERVQLHAKFTTLSRGSVPEVQIIDLENLNLSDVLF